MQRLRRLCRYSRGDHQVDPILARPAYQSRLEATCTEDTAHRPQRSEQKKTPAFGRKAEARRHGDYRNSDSCFGAKDGTLPLARCSLSSTWRFALHHRRDSLAARFIPTSFTRSRGMCCIGLATSQINGVVDEWGMARLSAPLLYRSER